jgi:hypothetical protein
MNMKMAGIPVVFLLIQGFLSYLALIPKGAVIFFCLRLLWSRKAIESRPVLRVVILILMLSTLEDVVLIIGALMGSAHHYPNLLSEYLGLSSFGAIPQQGTPVGQILLFGPLAFDVVLLVGTWLRKNAIRFLLMGLYAWLLMVWPFMFFPRGIDAVPSWLALAMTVWYWLSHLYLLAAIVLLLMRPISASFKSRI